MTEQQMTELIQNSKHLAGMDVTIHFTDEKGKVKRTSICTVLNEISYMAIGEDGGPKNYSVNVWVLENGTDKKHSISLQELQKQYPAS